MKKYEIVKEHYDFDNIINKGKNIYNKVFVIYYKKHQENFPKFGIAVGKKIGNAVVRNKYKRIIRNIIDENKLLFKKEYDYIIIIKRKCLEMSFNELNDSLSSLVKEKI
jgi:ribonuclease P protein component